MLKAHLFYLTFFTYSQTPFSSPFLPNPLAPLSSPFNETEHPLCRGIDDTSVNKGNRPWLHGADSSEIGQLQV